jgi:ubiquinone/menaquinone biosynthesis C-methylase UbiE
MSDQTIKFNDGAAYERGMGTWSRLAGEVFLEWLAPSNNRRWIDVGCGNGAFTELLVQQCDPAAVEGIDPSEEQLAFARGRSAARKAEFRQGDALTLPFTDNSFDIAAMALVIFFIPDPAKGVAEMLRVVRPGGTVTAYAWDLLRGGFPFEAIWDEMRALGVTPNQPPSADVSRMEAMLDLWTSAGLDAVETKEIVVQRTFEDFDDFWAISTAGTIGARIAKMPASDVEVLKARVRARLPVDAAGRVTFSARANAAKGRVPF